MYAFVENQTFCWFPAAIFVPLNGHQNGESIQSFVNSAKTFSEYFVDEMSFRPSPGCSKAVQCYPVN